MQINRQVVTAICLVLIGAASGIAQDSELPYELWLIDADGTNPRRLCDTTGYTCGSPDWSPDGKTIVFVRQQKEGEKQ